MTVDYHAPARFDDLLEVFVRVDRIGTTSVTYNSDVAENAAADVGNTAQNIAADIGNDVQKTGDKIENKVGNASISVKVDKDEKTANTTENKSK